ncbi:MAG: endonuclease/exonuclease/phosphatase family protein [Bacteroidaceae bacterium]|nr:endonuclease/exonuclease/phosphatase family protein [Bacteroidaceae bacterium]
MKYLFTVLFCCLLVLSATAQERRFRLVEWNVENLFDTLHDEGFDDRDFLPDGAYGWNAQRYRTKLSLVARTLAALGGSVPVDVMALCEVENDSVLACLTRQTLLARLGYEYVMTHSSDRRGIDVALLYQPMSFRPIATREYAVPNDVRGGRPLRHILYVKGETSSGDTLYIMVCHLPSRRGGRRASEPARLRASAVMAAVADSLLQADSTAKIIITGDFNDEPHNAAIRFVLSASPPPDAVKEIKQCGLYVLTARLAAEPGISGTYKFRGRWNRLDNIVVSGGLLSYSSFHTSESDCAIAALPHLLEPDGRRGEVRVRRTFLGTHFHGGASDHLPLTLDFYY